MDLSACPPVCLVHALFLFLTFTYVRFVPTKTSPAIGLTNAICQIHSTHGTHPTCLYEYGHADA